jgi:hypothetical protein
MNPLTPANAGQVRLLGLDLDRVLADNGVFITEQTAGAA